MKKNNNMKQLKELVNNSVAELVRLHVDGVQAYNISNNEYEVIVKFEKLRGRYYFIDRDGNKYLASSYDRAEFVAGEILERVAEEAATVKEAADNIAEKGEATIIFDLFWSYIEKCEARGINHGELVDRTEDAAGKMYNVYRERSRRIAEREQGERQRERRERRSLRAFQVLRHPHKDEERRKSSSRKGGVFLLPGRSLRCWSFVDLRRDVCDSFNRRGAGNLRQHLGRAPWLGSCLNCWP